MTDLDEETVAFLWELVEAARSVPRSQRGDFMLVDTAHGSVLRHPGLKRQEIDEGDLRDLIETGLIRITRHAGGSKMFDLRREAFDLYDRAHRDIDQPIAAQERIVTERVASDAFAARHRGAFDKWGSADALLWGEESAKNLTMIGHLCREAMQLFAMELVERHEVADSDPDPAKTVRRLRSVIDARKSNISKTNAALMDALVNYWGAVSDSVQRQEHGGQKEGEDLTWEDGRRVLLHTAMVMSECDRILS